ncbi:DHA2 family efflux MFS transporter permease subunit [Novosphingobium album (ex Liu et al. 2023)]|uniref:DHA2 family efflux MFS transporter permease subunit n=1 Tax=Novosphingobium album (ex Liu et al. 2023) TaxID=3031130 RepID=A0ABT5WWY9_9SPHN|nr:DHA2 family efflux MFS transporter permease subunit [Novosphingobium album (ex Liu et al. 2023)]MDE8654421.1 DHA2 family efflux MFS transporter permease subunit [Novosphingobium album (ex Liu et al. 2023)]
MTQHYMPPATRRLMTFFVMAAAIMNQVDTTIANVALPHIQGSTSASREQITWVLTSYIVALAIFTPLTGWLAGRFGRKRVVLFSIIGFTVASGLCGMAVNLDELIAFRILQGIAGASLVPMSQATLLDAYPPEEHGSAMAIFGLAAITGPLVGPLAGGYLTEHLSWRWVFFINLPIGVMAWIGLSATMPEYPGTRTARLDFAGFGLLAVAIGSLQLMLDRGQVLDWFGSTEIWIEAAIAAITLYLFIVHSMTTRHPFVSPAVFTDRNFVLCSIVGFFLGVLIYSPMSLLPEMLESLFGYPTMDVGMAMAPRGLGVLIAMLAIGRLINRVDFRVLVGVGMLLTAYSMWHLSYISLQSDSWIVVTTGVIQGVGSSMIFVPLSAMTFATLPAHLRNEGAALNTLVRSYGGAVGIALIQVLIYRNEAVVQSRLTEGLRPDNPAVRMAMPDTDFSLPENAARVGAEVVRQAMMVSYVDAFWGLCLVGIFASSLVLLLRAPKSPPAA